MVFAVQCPNARCRKYMLVEDHERNNVVACLLCKTPIRVGGGPTSARDPKSAGKENRNSGRSKER
jgi:hypothetical protein